MRSQGLPVNMIVLTVLAVLTMVVVAVFFFTGFGEASSSVQVVETDQADCQGICQGLITAGFNYNSCTSLTSNPQAVEYRACAVSYGNCQITIKRGTSCVCDANSCYDSPFELCSQSCGEFQGVASGNCNTHGGESYFSVCTVSHDCPINSNDCSWNCVCNAFSDSCSCV